jgi:hypothetical protein
MSSQPNPLMGATQGAGASSPLGGMMLSALQSKGAEGGGDPAEQYAQQSSELQGADPGMLLKQLNQINKLLGVIFVQTFQRLPNVANNISATMKQLSRAIKETQQAASTAQAINKPAAGGPGAGPIDFSAARPSIGPEAGGGGAGAFPG